MIIGGRLGVIHVCFHMNQQKYIHLAHLKEPTALLENERKKCVHVSVKAQKYKVQCFCYNNCTNNVIENHGLFVVQSKYIQFTSTTKTLKKLSNM